MYYRIIKNDIAKSKVISLITMLFIAAAAMFVSLAAILVVNLTGSIDTLMKQAKTPHFMQMHSGNINIPYLTDFAKQNDKVDEFQVLEFLGVDSDKIIIDGSALGGSVQDNGFCVQSEKFDFLLDLEGKIINVIDGEIYVPICYMKNGIAEIGDKVVVYDKQFIVVGFLRDSQMNSLLATSKRFLVSKNDYAKIKNFGNIEYLVEFRLKDLSYLSTFENTYNSLGFNVNGPMITYPLFKIINAMSDGLMIAVLILVSILVVLIAFMCIRFTLLAKIEDDYREIGVMKAIGLRISDIKKIYFTKYIAIALAGCILGLVFSYIFRDLLLNNIRLYIGESENSSCAILFGIMGILLVFLAIIVYVNKELKRFSKISVAEAIRFGNSQDNYFGGKQFTLSKIRLLGTNTVLGIKDILVRKRLYVTKLMVLMISAFIIIVPMNLYNTISSKNFIQYMGIGNCDIRIDIQQVSNATPIDEALEGDKTIFNYTMLTTKVFKAKMENGSEENIKIELGDHLLYPVQYAKGRAPITEDEIALSVINANEFDKKVGDTMTLVIQGMEKNLKVSGIYSDITNGGKTAKAAFSNNSAELMWSVIYVNLLDKSLVDKKVLEYKDRFEGVKISGIDNYITQTFGSTIGSVKKVAYFAMVVALIITVLITLLFIKMLVVKDRYSIAVMKALGFTNSDIITQYISRSVFILIMGSVLGTILANTVGEGLASMVIASFGTSSFKFEINPFSAYFLCPLMMVCGVLIATMIGTTSIEQIKISENIKE